MLVHLIRTKGVSDELYLGCYEFLNQFVGPYSFVLSDQPREITIKDEIRFVKPEDPRYDIKEKIRYSQYMPPAESKIQERKSWRDLFRINNKYRKSTDDFDSQRNVLSDDNQYHSSFDSDEALVAEERFDYIRIEAPYIVILLTEHANHENWFVGYDPNLKGNYFIHTDGWDHFTSGDPRYPVCYHIASTLLKHAMFDNPQEMGNYMHYESKGCMMDFCQNKSEVMLKLRTADVCPECQNLIRAKQITHMQLRYTFDVMEDIRRQLLFKDRYDLLRQATPMLVKGRSQKIFLPEMGMLQINLTPTERAVYLLFLNHPEGIRLAEMGEYKAELRGILNKVSPSDSRETIEGQLENLCEYNSNSLSEKMSRIKRKFDDKLGSAMAEHYYIKGPNGGIKKIDLDRNLLKFDEN
ncbi:MAG: hypothetical protein ORN56_08210 [Chitinophagales bacterium]|nr:hypothetical protein [Chitinophagales bacterium]